MFDSNGEIKFIDFGLAISNKKNDYLSKMSKNYSYDTKATVLNSQVKALEVDFIRRVNSDIAHKVTPVYNTFLLIAAAFFAYFIVVEENQCYAKQQEAWAVEYENTDDITK